MSNTNKPQSAEKIAQRIYKEKGKLISVPELCTEVANEHTSQWLDELASRINLVMPIMRDDKKILEIVEQIKKEIQ